MYAETQKEILNRFKGQDYCKIQALKKKSDATPFNVNYMSTIQLPKKTINCSFQCNSKSPTSNKEYTIKFNYLNKSLNFNTDEEFEKLIRLFQKINEYPNTSITLENDLGDLIKEVEKEYKESLIKTT